MATCLITGGAGFIGSHLADHLVGNGWTVRVLDDFSTGKRDNLSAIAGKITMLEGSILDRDALRRALVGVEVVFHEAAMVSVPQSVVDPVRCHEVCATGTLQLLQTAKDGGVRRVVYAGSASAYGDVSGGAIPESSPLEPRSPYAAAKLAGEHYCAAFAAVTGLETVRLRYFNVFGPRQDPSSPYSGVISLFCTQLLRGEQPQIYADGRQTRDFVFVTDVAEANRLAAVVPEISGRVFNIGTGRSTSVLELFHTIARLLGVSIEPRFAPARVGDVRHSLADAGAAASVLGFVPVVSLETGLRQCISFYRG
jgi:UDP-glucose 4-epimerase